MNDEKLYNSPYVASRIKTYAKIKDISLKSILDKCELGSNTFSHMLHGRSLAFDSLAKIADYLDCSVDYLLGRTDNPKVNRLDEEDGLKYTNVTFEDNKVRIAAFGGGVKDDDDEEVYTT